MGVRVKKIEEHVCDISGRPFKRDEEVRENYVIGDKNYDEVAQSTVDKIEAYVARLGAEPKPRAKKPQ